ncbi:hydroxyacid dehydrogenase [Phytohabitans kaempferiae]|uniref:Hydroxyacid dehydrogenase n=1 Tax=Phytohabitans kaempferiae TaxID=1620943 RepID=A0ABV6MDG1_9ACTN
MHQGPTVGLALSHALRAALFDGERERELAAAGTVLDCGDPGALGAALPDVDILVTGWGMPRLQPHLLDTAPRLKLIAHAGAAIRPFVTEAVFARGIRVTQAGAGMARPVAEVALAMTLALLHRVHRYDHAMRAQRQWPVVGVVTDHHELYGATVGVVGASRTGRAYIEMVRPLGARVLLSDPYVTSDAAKHLGVELLPLPDLLARCRIACVHAPATPATRHLLGGAELKLLPDGAGLVNTARSWLVDQEALLAELQSGRIDAALDVYDHEPLPADHPYRTLPNVLLTPHAAAATVEGRLRQGQVLASEVARFAAGLPLEHELRAGDLDRFA